MNRAGKENLDVILISMPFGPIQYPSLALSYFKENLRKSNISSKIKYFNISFANKIGKKDYDTIASGEPSTIDLMGEYIFSENASNESRIQRYVDEIILGKNHEHSKGLSINSAKAEKYKELVDRCSKLSSEFISKCAEYIYNISPKVIGFTTTFQQTNASLSLARKIKEILPETSVVFGGANCEGVMGKIISEKFRFIDHVFSGPSDTSFIKYCESFISEHDLSQNYSRFIPSSDVSVNLDLLPIPDFEDYFLDLNNHDMPTDDVRIPFETARGCWWGEKNHCTFCGLNGESMAFKSKSSSRAEMEIRLLANRYPGIALSAVDNIIDRSYFKNLLPNLAKEKISNEIFYEVKSNMTENDIKTLSSAGVVTIQPGIESLESSVLRRMKKGVTAVQNIELLKWCKKFSVWPEWNIIWGFPGDKEEEYNRMIEIIPLISHLPPPGGVGRIRMDRFSPNFNKSEEMGFEDIRPHSSYNHIFPELSEEDLFSISYYFKFNYKIKSIDDATSLKFLKTIDEWKFNYNKTELFSISNNENIIVVDLRHSAKNPIYILTNEYKEIFFAFSNAKSISKCVTELKFIDKPILKEEKILDTIEKLISYGLLLHCDNKIISLPIELDNWKLSPLALEILKDGGDVRAGSQNLSFPALTL